MNTLIAPLIIGGQGTYHDSEFHTEFPDRELSLEYMMEVAAVAHRFKYTHIVPSGGFTQSLTPQTSEAASFPEVWKEFAIDLEGRVVVNDEVALDSAENVICGLMAVRIHENANHVTPRRIGRIGFFSQWHFKKRRMTELARQLGIEKSFYFHGYAHALKAAAGDAAQSGEQRQLDRMIATNDFLLLAEEWETKRRQRFKPGRNDDGTETNAFISAYENRFANSEYDLLASFAVVYEALKSLKHTTIHELSNAAASQDYDARTMLEQVHTSKVKRLKEVFREQVILGKVEIVKKSHAS
ncbi:MAG: hypothetical protein H7039_02275 [Bryobacteraceae bacterium]|nr:hypothetical protein [Bryobacteraceae bacterium]